MKKIFKVLKKKGAVITFYKEDNKKFVEKKYLSKKDKDLAKREYKTIKDINRLLKSKGYKENTFNVYSYKNNSLIMDYVQGLPLDKYLIKNSRNNKKINLLKKEFQKLGKLFRIIQEHYKIKDIDKNLFIKKKIFAAAIGNFIYNQTITPLDLGSKNEKVVNLEQVAKFINFLYIMKPWQALTYNFKINQELEKEFLKGYFGELTIKEYELIYEYRKKSLKGMMDRKSKNFKEKIKHFYLNLLCSYLIAKLNKKNLLKKELDLFTDEIGNDLNWCFYKEDILYPHLVNDIDLVCEEDEKKVTKIMKNKGFSKISKNLFQKFNIKYHFHYNKKTHNELLKKDIGDIVLKNKIKTKIYKPKWNIWIYVRIAYILRKPKKWLIKQIQRIK